MFLREWLRKELPKYLRLMFVLIQAQYPINIATAIHGIISLGKTNDRILFIFDIHVRPREVKIEDFLYIMYDQAFLVW